MNEMGQGLLYLTEEQINHYLEQKQNEGLKPTAVAKYRTTLAALYRWLGEDKRLSVERLTQWRNSLKEQAYLDRTLRHYVTTVNTFLRSCGYERLCIPKPLKRDLTGQVFGYLQAIEPVGKNDRSNIIWRCHCKCGNEVEAPATLLITMNTTSCGCLKIEKFRYANRYVEGTELRSALRDEPISKRAVSGFTGVRPKGGKWLAQIQYKGVRYNLGTYSRIEDAVKARARAKEQVIEDARKLYETTEHLFGEMPARPPKPVKTEQAAGTQTTPIKAKRTDNRSGHTGVFFADHKWMANIAYRGVRYVLGYYLNIEDAIAVRRLAEEYVAAGDVEKLLTITTRQDGYTRKES